MTWTPLVHLSPTTLAVTSDDTRCHVLHSSELSDNLWRVYSNFSRPLPIPGIGNLPSHSVARTVEHVSISQNSRKKRVRLYQVIDLTRRCSPVCRKEHGPRYIESTIQLYKEYITSRIAHNSRKELGYSNQHLNPGRRV